MTTLGPAGLAALREFSTPTVCNAIETFAVRLRTEGFVDRSIVCRFPEAGRMAGYAVTAKLRASRPPEEDLSLEATLAEFERVPRPWVVVVEDLDYPDCIGSYWGEVNASTYSALGAVGVVTNGGVRDLPEVRPTGFHVFSASVLVSHAHAHVVEAGCPVSIGGLTVHAGDLLHGDEHGVTNIPPEIAGLLPDRCRDVERAERSLIDYARSPGPDIRELLRRYREVD